MFACSTKRSQVVDFSCLPQTRVRLRYSKIFFVTLILPGKVSDSWVNELGIVPQGDSGSVELALHIVGPWSCTMSARQKVTILPRQSYTYLTAAGCVPGCDTMDWRLVSENDINQPSVWSMRTQLLLDLVPNDEQLLYLDLVDDSAVTSACCLHLHFAQVGQANAPYFYLMMLTSANTPSSHY